MSVSSVLSQLSTPPTAASGDPKVEASFVLGWQLAELLYLQETSPTGTLPLLPSVAVLPFNVRCQVLSDEIVAGIQRVGLTEANASATVLSATEPVPDPTNPVVQRNRLTPAAVAALRQLHLELLRDLTIADFRMGKAYSLGVGLAETTLIAHQVCSADTGGLEPSAATEAILSELFGSARVHHQIRELRDLKTSFQWYSVDAVSATVHDWAEWMHMVIPKPGRASRIKRRESWPDIARHYLDPQSLIWRALLSGEKDATDTLQVADYLNSVQNLAGQYWTIVRGFLSHFSALLLAIPLVLLVAAAVVLVKTNQLGPAYAAAAAFFGFLGLSGATVTAAVKNALSQTEDHLWQAELAGAVALAVDHVPDAVPKPEVKRLASTQHTTPANRTTEALKKGGLLARIGQPPA